MKIIWSDKAENSLDEILDYLEDKFSVKTASEFDEEVYGIIRLIRENPFLFPIFSGNSIRKAIIHKYTTLFYRIEKDKNEILLISFFQSRKNPDKRPTQN